MTQNFVHMSVRCEHTHIYTCGHAVKLLTAVLCLEIIENGEEETSKLRILLFLVFEQKGGQMYISSQSDLLSVSTSANGLK